MRNTLVSCIMSCRRVHFDSQKQTFQKIQNLFSSEFCPHVYIFYSIKTDFSKKLFHQNDFSREDKSVFFTLCIKNTLFKQTRNGFWKNDISTNCITSCQRVRFDSIKTNFSKMTILSSVAFCRFCTIWFNENDLLKKNRNIFFWLYTCFCSEVTCCNEDYNLGILPSDAERTNNEIIEKFKIGSNYVLSIKLRKYSLFQTSNQYMQQTRRKLRLVKTHRTVEAVRHQTLW